jgi:hypothetical protein
VIPVTPRPEPPSFEAAVRRPGLDAIAELVGEAPSRSRPGPQRKVVAASRERIPAGKFPELWRAALPDLREAYGNLCAYLALYLHHATGSATVDHFVPKSKDWRLVYEWSNYRLCSSIINAKKLERQLKVDPFTIPPGLFALELTDFQVVPGPGASEDMADLLGKTINEDLGLNQRECLKARREYVEQYLIGPSDGIALARLERHAPFIAQELRRQGRLVRGDV